MKYLLLFCCALFAFNTSTRAQFAPVGAEWWYQGGDEDFVWFGPIEKHWVDHTIITGDTTVAGIAARKMQTTRYAKSTTSPATVFTYDTKTSIVYDTPDTVFIFDDHREAFIPLYVYNVQEGDTVTLPVPGAYLSSMSDTVFSFIIDSIRMRPFDTASLKTYFTRAIKSEAWNLTYNWGDFTWLGDDGIHLGQYSERLGGTASIASIQPLSVYHNPDAGIVSILPAGKLACYTDAMYNVKLVDIACDSIADFYLSATEPDLLSGFTIYPNPATDVVNIAAAGNLPQHTTATLFDISGRNVASVTGVPSESAVKINTGHLVRGLYWLRLSANGKPTVYRKIVLQ